MISLLPVCIPGYPADGFFNFKILYMSLRLGDKAPNFQAKTSIGEIDFYEFLGDSWGILFSHPADYTPVCTTELGRTAALKDEFAKRNVKVLALSVEDRKSVV